MVLIFLRFRAYPSHLAFMLGWRAPPHYEQIWGRIWREKQGFETGKQMIPSSATNVQDQQGANLLSFPDSFFRGFPHGAAPWGRISAFFRHQTRICWQRAGGVMMRCALCQHHARVEKRGELCSRSPVFGSGCGRRGAGEPAAS